MAAGVPFVDLKAQHDAVVDIAHRTGWNLEIESIVDRVRLGATHVVLDA